jgi:hypothetical protein
VAAVEEEEEEEEEEDCWWNATARASIVASCVTDRVIAAVLPPPPAASGCLANCSGAERADVASGCWLRCFFDALLAMPRDDVLQIFTGAFAEEGGCPRV